LSPDIASAAAQEFGHGYSNRQNGCSGQTAMFFLGFLAGGADEEVGVVSTSLLTKSNA